MIDRASVVRTPARELAIDCLEAGLEASDPERVIRHRLSIDGDTLSVDTTEYDLAAYDRILVLGGGKAGARQARAIESLLGDRIDAGVVVTNDQVSTERIELLQSDHPIPSERGVAATRTLLELAESADHDTLVIVLITGGGSALLPAPAPGIELSDLKDVTDRLLASGAEIEEINAVRKHLSTIKGGGLARALAPADVVSLIMSDVVGDDLSVIASGPTVPDESTFADAETVLERHSIDRPEAVAERLRSGAAGEYPETPAPGDSVFDCVQNHLVADGATPMRAGAAVATERGYRALQLSARIRGEAREAAKTHVAIGEEILASGQPVEPPAVVLSGGETTVTIQGEGAGGPNQEFALSGAIELGAGITLAAIDTDGIDGSSPAAGGVVDRETVEDPQAARDALERNDAYSYLANRGDVIETGPTGTNLNDYRVMVVESVDAAR